jgi:PAS domain S-box-containing protein
LFVYDFPLRSTPGIEMPTPSTDPDDAGRLEELRALQLLTHSSEPAFDNLTQLASEICDTPVALISFVGQDRIWFKARIGFDDPDGPREHSFCAHAVEGTGPMVVEDATADRRFQDNVYVRAPQGVRFYAGIPLVLSSGYAVGTLCVLDHKVRTLSDRQLSSLQKLALQVTALIEAKRTALRLHEEDQNRQVIEQRLDFALEAADIGDWDMDLRTNVARRSLMHDRCFGYTEAVPVWGYDTFLAHIIEADRARVDGSYQRAMAGQGAYDVEFRVVWPDQTLHWLWSKGRFYFDGEGKPVRVAGIQVDITERKLAADALRVSEFALQAISQGVTIAGADQRITSVNAGFTAITGYPAAEILGRDCKFLQGPDTDPQTVAAIRAALSRPAEFAGEILNYRKDGTVFWNELTIAPVLGAHGILTHFIGITRDISARRAAELQLRHQESQLSQADTLAGLGRWDWNLTDDSANWSDGLYRIYGRDPAQGVPAFDDWQETIHPEDEARLAHCIQTALAGASAYQVEFRIFTKDTRQLRYVESRGSSVVDANGKPTHIRGCDWDITERKLAEHALQAALEEKTALLKEVHHRVKNNLQVITSLLRLEAGRSLVSDTKEVLGYMRSRIRTMAQLHESLYRSGTFASVDLGVYLSQVASQAFKTQEIHLDSVQLTLRLGSVQSGMDQAQAAGLLLNELISNCLKHGFPEGQTGEVSVELQPANDQGGPGDGRWCLRVWDTGVGLPPDFEDKRKNSLGLQLATDLSRQLGGTLEIDAVPGVGARFNVVFPVQAPAALVMPP